jgi:hypothetical protein
MTNFDCKPIGPLKLHRIYYSKFRFRTACVPRDRKLPASSATSKSKLRFYSFTQNRACIGPKILGKKPFLANFFFLVLDATSPDRPRTAPPSSASPRPDPSRIVRRQKHHLGWSKLLAAAMQTSWVTVAHCRSRSFLTTRCAPRARPCRVTCARKLRPCPSLSFRSSESKTQASIASRKAGPMKLAANSNRCSSADQMDRWVGCGSLCRSPKPHLYTRSKGT